MNKTLIIYPQDSSTKFLLDAFNFLKERIKDFTFYEVQPNEASHNQSISLIEKHECIVFMGHGSHLKLSSAFNESFEKDHLVSFEDFEKLNNKLWLLFSCNSNDLIKRCSAHVNSGIGFGNLPTDFNDIQGAREFDSKAYQNVNANVINEFKKAIVWLIIESVYALYKESLSFRDLYNRVRILIDRRMIDSLENIKGNDGKEVAYLLHEMKQDSEFFKSISA